MTHDLPIISLLTDFGTADGFVGTMKGVMLGICPNAQFTDLSHLIRPQDVRQAAFVLMTAAPFFPDRAVHLIVVDPGVGSARRPVAVQTPRHLWVAPDNGVLTYALAQEDGYQAVALENPAYRLGEVSSTFHGRDIFSPVAAHLAAGVPLADLGPAVEDLILLETPVLSIEGSQVDCEVLNVDHFGNLRTSLLRMRWEEGGMLNLNPIFGDRKGGSGIRFDSTKARVHIGPISIDGIFNTFSDVPVGELVAFIGSEGGLEIAVNQGNYAIDFGTKIGDRITVEVGGFLS